MSFCNCIVSVIESKNQGVYMIDINVVLIAGISRTSIIYKLTIFNRRFAIRNISAQNAHLISIEKAIGHPKIGTFLADAGVFASRGEARRTIAGGGLTINGERVTDPASVPQPIAGEWLDVRIGKRRREIGRRAS